MKVIEVEQFDLINSIPSNVLIFNKETQSYFKKDASVNLIEDTTFRDAILNQYKQWSRFREKVVENDYIKYYDTDDEIKILEVFNERDMLKAKAEQRVLNFDISTVLDVINTNELKSFNASKLSIDDDYLTKFARIVYVDQKNGIDINDGTRDFPVKTIRRAESLIIENTAVVILPGVYDITTGNTQTNKRYCISGLAGNYDTDKSLTVEYINMGAIEDVILVVDTQGLDWEARDITFINGIHNSNSKVIGITFKMIDKIKETAFSVSITRESEGVQLIDCVFDLDVLNGNIVYFNKVGRDSVVFKNSIIDLKKELNGVQYDAPYSGTYELDGCFINEEIKTKLQTFDSQNMDIRGTVSLLNNLNTVFFSKL
jgi:hypothetical protein